MPRRPLLPLPNGGEQSFQFELWPPRQNGSRRRRRRWRFRVEHGGVVVDEARGELDSRR